MKKNFIGKQFGCVPTLDVALEKYLGEEIIRFEEPEKNKTFLFTTQTGTKGIAKQP
ncbi:hypothetical protein [Thermoflavimicrobium daqui]|uniref:hypothetical protein n=1 Tax=Thermoflavimicrobium daqui TaxID=2137476 RepID=UPI00143D0F50|nr:hypothetical protein [Thermoflavimicrobium daqui]